MPPIVAAFQGHGLTEQNYEEGVRQLTGTKNLMESLSDWPVPGILAHVAGQASDGFRVVDVWESEESFQRFGEIIGPIMQGLGVDLQPDIYPAKAFVSA